MRKTLWNYTPQPGDVFAFTRDLDGVCPVRAGNTGRYLGDSMARILDGPSAEWLVRLCIDAPIEFREEITTL